MASTRTPVARTVAGTIPFTAMVLWQAIALAGGLSMIGAMLVYGLEPIGDNLIAGLKSLAGMVFNNEPTTALGFWHLLRSPQRHC